MNPKEFHKLASILVKSNSPAEVRSAVSRSYYAVYNLSVQLLDELGFKIAKGPGAHGDVQNRLSNGGDTDIRRVGSQLGDLRGKRIKADYRYDDLKAENQKTAVLIVEQAEKMLNTLDECSKEPKRSQVFDAIKDYENKISGGGSTA